MAKKHKDQDHHDPNHILEKDPAEMLGPGAFARAELKTKNKALRILSNLKNRILSSGESRFITFIIAFAIVGGGIFLWSSFADSQMTFSNQVACVDIYAGNHQFVHNGNCTAYEINPEGLTSHVFTWCALASNADAWQNDGACPAAPPPPPPTGDKTYSESACIDPTPSNHQFVHTSGCTPNERNVVGLIAQNFTWCAAAANANTWKNDGPCPSTPGGVDVSISSSSKNITAGSRITLHWTIAGKIDRCPEVMGAGSLPDSFWSQTLHSSSDLTFAPPSIPGRYIYGIDCYLGTSKVAGATVTILVSPPGITYKGYTQSACINPGNNQHYFYHSGECTGNDNSQGYVSADPFSWCATATSSANWQNDGPCPIDPPAPDLSGSTADQPDDATPGDDNLDQDFGLQADAVGANAKRNLHVLYVVPSDYKKLGDNSQFNTRGQINTSIAAVNNWMKKQTVNKVFRFDTKSGAIDITAIKLNETYGQIANSCSPLTKPVKCTPGTQLMQADLNTQLAANLQSYANKKYVVYYEGTYPTPSVCGTNLGPYSIHFLRANNTCDNLATSSSSPKMAEYALIRNVIQNLGYVSNSGCSPPNFRPGGYVSDSALDVMYPTTYSDSNLSKVVLDAGHNDYFDNWGKAGATATKCDLNKNPFLALAKPIKIIDISFPQGGNKYTADIGIVGVNGGKPQSKNSHLKSQVQQFKQAGLYVNTSYTNQKPGSKPSCQDNSAKCAAQNVGYNDGLYDINYAKSQGVSATQWWIDVEGYYKVGSAVKCQADTKTGNPWTSDTGLNQAYLQGMTKALTDHGAKTVGFYSTTSLWNCLTGSWRPSQRSWLAIYSSPPVKQSDQDKNCAQSFTGSSLALVQYIQNGRIDVDVACSPSYYNSL